MAYIAPSSVVNSPNQVQFTQMLQLLSHLDSRGVAYFADDATLAATNVEATVNIAFIGGPAPLVRIRGGSAAPVVTDAGGASWGVMDVSGLLPDATTTVKGKVELATDTETKAGTDTTRAVTPAGLKGALEERVSIHGAFIGTAAPTGPQNGTMWLDTSGANPVLKLRSSGAWVTVPGAKHHRIIGQDGSTQYEHDGTNWVADSGGPQFDTSGIFGQLIEGWHSSQDTGVGANYPVPAGATHILFYGKSYGSSGGMGSSGALLNETSGAHALGTATSVALSASPGLSVTITLSTGESLRQNSGTGGQSLGGGWSAVTGTIQTTQPFQGFAGQIKTPINVGVIAEFMFIRKLN